MPTFHIFDGFTTYVAPGRSGGLRTPNPLKDIIGTYCVTVIETGMVYIGSTANLAQRVSVHLSDLKYCRHSNPKLQEAYNTDTDIEIIVKPAVTITEAQSLEQHLVDHFKDSGYLCNVGTVDVTKPNLGTIRTEKQRQNMSDAHRGLKIPETTGHQISVAQKAFYQTEQGQANIRAMSKKFTLDGVEYPSIIGASRTLKQPYSSIRNKAIKSFSSL